MKALISPLLLAFLLVGNNYSYGQLNLNSNLPAGQYYNPIDVNAQPSTTAIGNAIGTIHLFINSSSVTNNVNYLNSSNPSNVNLPGFDNPINTSLPVGKTNTSYGVSPYGSATYNIPIIVPPGTMQMQPNLSVVYNSAGNDGSVGYGWNISGLSNISRLGQTPYHNYGGNYPDQFQAITMSNSDWFGLDNNRLIVTNDGTNGASGTTYGTENETFNLVTSYGTIGNGPEWFQVKTKSGVTMEYGHTLDSRLVPVGQATVYTWYVDKITDQFGNYITFHYQNSNGEVLIQEIDYTGNDDAAITPYNSMVFDYQKKEDVNTIYVAGSTYNSTGVLSNIIIKAHNQLFKEYTFKYIFNIHTMLQEVDETGSDNTTLNPLQFSYTEDVIPSALLYGYFPFAMSFYSSDPNALHQFAFLDYNGDGKTDIIEYSGAAHALLNFYPNGQPDYSLDNQYTLTLNPPTLYENTSSLVVGATPTFTTGSPVPSISSIPFDGLGTAEHELPMNTTSGGDLHQTEMDFNGDGKDDIASSYSVSVTPASNEGSSIEENIEVALSTGTSFQTPYALVTYSMAPAYSVTYQNGNEYDYEFARENIKISGTYFLDLNGDKQMDVFNYHFDPTTCTEYYRVWINAANSSVTEFPTSNPNFEIQVKEPLYFLGYDYSDDNWPMMYGYTWLDFSNAIPVDLYGDGREELINVIQWTGGRSSQRVIVGFNANQVYGQPNYTAEVDGTPNVPGAPGNGIVITPDNNTGIAYTNSYYTQAIGSTAIANQNYVLYGDFNGDGITDIVSYSSNTSSWTINYGTGSATYSSFPLNYPTPSIAPTWNNPFNYPFNYYYAVDVNGDGKTDIIQFSYIQSGDVECTLIDIYYSTGTSFIAGPAFIFGQWADPTQWQVGFGDFNGDGTTDIFLDNQLATGYNQPTFINLYGGAKSKYLAEAVDGYDEKVKFYYQPLSNSDLSNTGIYQQPKAIQYRNPTSQPSNPLIDCSLPWYIVTMLTTPDGTGNHTTIINGSGNNLVDTSSTTYNYQDAIHNQQGLGFLGFLNTTSSNSVSGFTTSVGNTVLSPFYNMVENNSTTNLTLSPYTHINSESYSYIPTPEGGLQYFLSKDICEFNDNIAGTTSTTSYSYDSYGNVTDQSTQLSAGSNVVASTDVQQTYTTSATWIPSKIATSIVSDYHQPLGNALYVRQTNYIWDSYGRLNNVIQDPSSSEQLTTTYTYDSRTGSMLSKNISSVDPTCVPIDERYQYDNLYQFLTGYVNPLGQQTSFSYSPLWGKLNSETSPNGIVTYYAYDGYGNLTQVTTPGNLTENISYNWASSIPPDYTYSITPFNITATSLFSSFTQTSGYPSKRIFYSWLNKPTGTQTDGFSNTIYTAKAYDSKGNEYQTANNFQMASIGPQYGNYDPVTITNLYDFDNRLVNVQTTCASQPILTTTYTYTPNSGNMITAVTKPDGTVSSQTVDPAGLLIKTTDYVYNSYPTIYSEADYTYSSNNRIESTSLNGTQVNSCYYDNYGRQTQLNDVNFNLGGSGSGYQYQYNAYNELVKQQDPNGNLYTMTYDALERLTKKVSTLEGTYTYSFVTSGNGLNLIQSQTAPNGNTVSYTYDNFNRPLQVNVNGLLTTYAYDPTYGYLINKTYPGSGFGIKNSYNSKGYLTETQRADNNAPIWTAYVMNPFGQCVDYELGNGDHTIKAYSAYDLPESISDGSNTYENISYNFDPTNDNLKSKIENGNLTESFTYDSYLNNRLSESQSYYPCSSVLSESLSNQVADIKINFDQDGNIVGKSDICNPGTYTNGNTNNQITEVPNSNNLITAGQSVTYTSFDEPLTMSLGNYSMSFAYGPDNNREKTILTGSGNTITRYYATNYEKTLVNNANPVELNYIECGGALVAVYVNQSSGGSMYYAYSDNLGSLLTLTNGTNTYNQDFDAWGNYTLNGMYTGAAPAANPTWMYRGYTGHEHLPDFQLINANGRLYDPLNNTMLSPDPYIQDITNTQNANRYSYCLNNPLKYSDPTGFIPFSESGGAGAGSASGNDNNYLFEDPLGVGADNQYLSVTADKQIGGSGIYYNEFSNNANGGGFGDAGFAIISAINWGLSDLGDYTYNMDKYNKARSVAGGASNLQQAEFTINLQFTLDPVTIYSSHGAFQNATEASQQIAREAQAAYNAYLAWQNLNPFQATSYLFAAWTEGIHSANSGYTSNMGYVFNDNAVSNSFRHANGVEEARYKWYQDNSSRYMNSQNLENTKLNSDPTFPPLTGPILAGLDPIQQFVGSYNVSTSVVDNGTTLQYTITNTTSFYSASYHLWPYGENWDNGPMSDQKQTYIFYEPINYDKLATFGR